MSTYTERQQDRTARCAHFNGVQHDSCAAGVRYQDVRQENAHGWLLPCRKNWGHNGETIDTCAMRRWVTIEEARIEEEEAQAALTAFLTDLAEDRCPHCHQAVRAYEQVGRCVYADPCGHRLYQGRVPKDKPVTTRADRSERQRLDEWNALWSDERERKGNR